MTGAISESFFLSYIIFLSPFLSPVLIAVIVDRNIIFNLS